MAFQLRDRRIAQIGVIGAGRMGPDIALDLARALLRFRVPVVLMDSADDALVRAQGRIKQSIQQQVAARQLSTTDGDLLSSLVRYTVELDQIKQANLLIEAIGEELQAKRQLYERIEATCRQDALLLSTSAHLQPEALFAGLRNPRRALVARYAYPADRSPTIELAPGPSTSGLLLDFLELFYELIGKAPVIVKNRYGHALSPVLEALLLAGCLAVEQGWATVKQVDAVCRLQLGHALGPFTMMNATGTTAAAEVALGHYGVRIMPWYHAPRLLKEQLKSKRPWDSPGPHEDVPMPPPLFEQLSAWLLGAYFAAVAELIDARMMELTALDEAVGLGLALREPFNLMNQIGIVNAFRLVERFAYDNSGVKIGQRLREQAANRQPWPLRYVSRRDDDEVAVLTIRRFKQLNALNAEVLRQLHDHLLAIESDESVQAIVIRGFGTRAFSSGMEITELAALGSIEDAEMVARRGQAVLRTIERSPKPVVAALGGIALGEGNELALACHARIASWDLPILCGQPQPKLGLMPGHGATQRLPRLIDFRLAWEMLRTGEPIGSAEAHKLGLVSEIVAPDVLRDRAVELAGDLARGRIKVQPIDEGPITVPQTLPPLELDGLSRAVDSLIKEAILEGARGGLEAGLDLEARLFGKLVATRDFRIGVDTFLKHGPKVRPEFVHR